MAKFNMRPTHCEQYRSDNLRLSEKVYGKAYAEDVKLYMEQIRKQKK
jgi:hypothetical protein